MKTEIDKIAPAVCKAMGMIKKLGKGERNKHDNYDFVSIDNFLEAVNPICAEVGLFFPMSEIEIIDFVKKGKYGENSWIRTTFEITAYHSSGQSMPPVTRSVEVMRNGAQASGSSQSYALKQYLRGLFLIPTGDKDDADFQPTDNGVVSNQPQAPVKNGAPKNEATRDIYKELQAEIDACGTDLDCLQILSEDDSFKERVKRLPNDWQRDIRARYKEVRTDALTAAEEKQ